VAKDAFRYIAPSWWAPPPGDANQMPEELSQYYTTPGWTGAGLSRAQAYYGADVELQSNGTLLEGLRQYERLTRMTGVLLLALLVPGIAALFLCRGRARAGAALMLATGAVLLLVPAATIFYDYRFAIPAVGCFAAAAALGGRPLWSWIRARAAKPSALTRLLSR
jgi:hypothetical protein